VKAYLTTRVDTYRPSYARRPIDVPRQQVYVGTVNGDAYLKDDTGGRRFWPVKIGTIDITRAKKEREQLWAEAFVRYKKGEAWHITDKAVLGLAEQEQEERRQLDPWEPVIAKYLDGAPMPGTDGKTPREETRAKRRANGVTTAQIFDFLGIEVIKRDRLSEMRIGGILRALGWERVRIRTIGGRSYFYRPVGDGSSKPLENKGELALTLPKSTKFEGDVIEITKIRKRKRL